MWQEVRPSGRKEGTDLHIRITGDQGENPIPGKGEEYQNRPSH